MDRTKFFNIVSVDGINELDFLDNTLSGFTLTRPTYYYRVQQNDIQVPDNIAYKIYGNEKMWWVICLANGIYDCAADLVVGKLLKIPDLLDIWDFYKRYKRR